MPGRPAGSSTAPVSPIPSEQKQIAAIIGKLYEAFVTFDAMLCEINPLIVTPEGEVRALDSKFTVDDNALYRHPEIAEMRDRDAADPLEALAREKHVTYVKLDGEVGVLGNGAGLTMSTVDVVTFAGGRPANFCDLGGGGDAQGVVDALSVITQDPQVKAIFFNIFGGITRCDEVARGILQALERHEARAADRGAARRDERRGRPSDPRRGGTGEPRGLADHARGGRARRGACSVSDPWNERAALYVESDAHREGEDLEALRAAGRRARGPRSTSRPEVVTSPGGSARRGSTSSPATRRPACTPTSSAAPSRSRSPIRASTSSPVAPPRTTSATSARRSTEMARVARESLVIVDTMFMGDDVEAAEKLRDPSHVRNYTDAEWRGLVADTGLALDDVRFFAHTFDFDAWLDAHRLRG